MLKSRKTLLRQATEESILGEVWRGRGFGFADNKLEKF